MGAIPAGGKQGMRQETPLALFPARSTQNLSGESKENKTQDLEERRKCFVDRGDVGGLRKKFACCGAGVST